MGIVKRSIYDAEGAVFRAMKKMDDIAAAQTELDNVALNTNGIRHYEAVIRKAEKAIGREITRMKDRTLTVDGQLLVYAIEMGLVNVVGMLVNAGANPLHTDVHTGKDCRQIAQIILEETMSLKEDGLYLTDREVDRARTIFDLIKSRANRVADSLMKGVGLTHEEILKARQAFPLGGEGGRIAPPQNRGAPKILR